MRILIMRNRYGFLRKNNKDFPLMVHVETTNVCNIRCIHCPQSNPYRLVPSYKPQHIDFKIWKNIVDEVCRYDSVLRLTPDGEPLIVPDWNRQVDYVLKKRVKKFAFNTNGLLLEGSKMDVLFRGASTQIIVEFSIDAFWKSTYDRIRVKSDYSRVLKNIFNFQYEIKKQKKKNIKLLVSIVIQPELEKGEYELFVNFWEQIVDKVITRRYVDTKGIMPRKRSTERRVVKRWPCVVPFTRLVVTYDGQIRFCPDDWRKESTVGFIKHNSIREVWRGNAMKEIRNNHLNLNFSKAHPLCGQCTDWKVIEWGNDYTNALKEL